MCGEPEVVEDQTITFHLFQARDDAFYLAGRLDAPGITLGPSWKPAQSERWSSSLYVYYPNPGDNVDISSEFFPPGTTGPWDPSRAKGWVRVLVDTCFSEFQDGWVHIDIDLASGRVINFARKCEEDWMTFWYDYHLRGEGELICEPNSCNDVVNDAPVVEPVAVAQSSVLTQGEIHAGRYHLKSMEYEWHPSCSVPEPSATAETLEVDAFGATNGSMSLVREVVGRAPVHAKFYYSEYGIINMCGEEALTGDYGSLQYSASETELRLRLYYNLVCDFGTGGFVDYVYEKQ